MGYSVASIFQVAHGFFHAIEHLIDAHRQGVELIARFTH